MASPVKNWITSLIPSSKRCGLCHLYKRNYSSWGNLSQFMANSTERSFAMERTANSKPRNWNRFDAIKLTVVIQKTNLPVVSVVEYESNYSNRVLIFITKLFHGFLPFHKWPLDTLFVRVWNKSYRGEVITIRLIRVGNMFWRINHKTVSKQLLPSLWAVASVAASTLSS